MYLLNIVEKEILELYSMIIPYYSDSISLNINHHCSMSTYEVNCHYITAEYE